mmetsp:Transcript_39892/g.119386  ORF Transcript_39892/g.119386 Transcript_39892/m.119386 type:complete len:339 (-) Transcript_39892:290-1306(-)
MLPTVPLASSEGRAHGDVVRADLLLRHSSKDLQRLEPLTCIPARANGCVEGEDVWADGVGPQLPQQRKCLLPLPTLAADADRHVVRDHVQLMRPPARVLQELHSVPPEALAFAAGKSGAVGQDVGLEPARRHLLQGREGLRPERSPFARRDQGALGHHVRRHSAAGHSPHLLQRLRPVAHAVAGAHGSVEDGCVGLHKPAGDLCKQSQSRCPLPTQLAGLHCGYTCSRVQRVVAPSHLLQSPNGRRPCMRTAEGSDHHGVLPVAAHVLALPQRKDHLLQARLVGGPAAELAKQRPLGPRLRRVLAPEVKPTMPAISAEPAAVASIAQRRRVPAGSASG